MRNKTGTGSWGESRQEGNQTLKTERSGRGKPAASGPPFPDVLKGTKAQERRWLAAAGWLGRGVANSKGRRNSKRW